VIETGDAQGRGPGTGSTSRFRVRTALLLAILACLLLLPVAALTVWVSGHRVGSIARSTPTAASVTLALAQTGPTQGSDFVSNERVHLHWTEVQGTPFYRLQVVIAHGGRRHASFRHPLLTTLVSQSAYSLPVLGAQRYYWRVQAFVDGRWQPYSKPRHFTVQQPVVGSPAPRTPRSGSHIVRGSIKLCWAAIPGAIGYEVRVVPHGASVVTETCETVALPAGTYRWSVAAFVQGARVYTGPYSAWARFAVGAAPRVQRAVVAAQPVALPAPPPAPSAPAAAAPVRRAPLAPAPIRVPFRRAPPPAGAVVKPTAAPLAGRSPAAKQNAKPPSCIAFVNC